MKAIGKLAVDTHAVIAFRSGVSTVYRLIKSAEYILCSRCCLRQVTEGMGVYLEYSA